MTPSWEDKLNSVFRAMETCQMENQTEKCKEITQDEFFKAFKDPTIAVKQWSLYKNEAGDALDQAKMFASFRDLIEESNLND